MEIKELIRTAVLWLLTLEARAVLWRYQPRLILVTGSVGKTSTKDALYTALKKYTFVRKSEKSFNSDIGVPLTILGLPNGWSNIAVWLTNLVKGLVLLLAGAPYPKWLIVEVGADRPGDISRSLRWLKPSVVVATRFPDVPVHVEFYENPEAVSEEELFPLSLLGEGDTAVVNYDDARAVNYPVADGVRRITYGFAKGADVRAMRVRAKMSAGALSGLSFDVVVGEERTHVSLHGVVGEGHVYSCLAGIAAALASGVSVSEAALGFTEHVPPPGRLRLIRGVNGSMIIDDSYNASPAATEEGLKALDASPGKRIAVLGDMFELGAYSVSEHARIGELAATHADVLITVGVRARGFAEGARGKGMSEEAVYSFERGSDAASFLLSTLAQGDTVLIKGSQGMRMERIVRAIMAEPEKAKDLLVRQDAEWLLR